MTQQFYDFVNTGQFAAYIQANTGCGSGCAVPTTVGPIFQSQLQKFPLAMPLVNSKITCPIPVPVGTTDNRNCYSQSLFYGGATVTSGLPSPVPVYDTATEQAVTPIDQYRFSVKFDHKFTANDQLNAVYLFEDTHFQCNF